MRVIDAHVHLWPGPRPGYAPSDAPGQAFPRDLDGSAESLIAQMDGNGIERAVVVQTPWWAHDDRYMHEAVARFPGRFTTIACIALRLEDCDLAAAAARIRTERLAGMRIHVVGKGAAGMIAAGALDRLFAVASARGTTILFWGRHPAAFALYAGVARRFPELRIVIDHMGYAAERSESHPIPVDELSALARYPLTYVKLSLHYQHSRLGYPWPDVFGLQRRLIAEFGASRCLWGSNWPMQSGEPTYAQRLTTITEAFSFRSEEERAWVLAGTAAALWPMDQTIGRKR